MMTNESRDRGRLAADEVFDAGNRPDDIRAAMPEAGEARSAYLERLAIRSAVHAAASQGGDFGPVPTSVAARLRAAYDQGRSHAAVGEADLTKLGPWRAAQGAFAGDMEFIMKLMGRRVTTPTAGFVRYVADALGANLASVRRHFETPGGLVFSGVERKSSGKPAAPRVEDFAIAVGSAEVPQELKDHWLAE